MAHIKDGGPAFPATRLEENPLFDSLSMQPQPRFIPVEYGGMTLRDYFAAQALIGLLSCEPWVRGLDSSLTTTPGQFKPYVAAHAYYMADAMLAEREK